MSRAISALRPISFSCRGRPEGVAVIVVRGCEFPDDRWYHADFNVWLQRCEHGGVKLGATSFGAALAVEFFAFMPKSQGTKIDAGRAVGLLELSKTVVSVRSPCNGTLLEANPTAVNNPSVISRDPYGAGWLVRLMPEEGLSNLGDGLLSGNAIAPAFESAMELENYQGSGW